MRDIAGVGVRYRVWITGYDNWQPSELDDVPPLAVALELAEEGTMSAEQARAYVVAFNRAAQTAPTLSRWAVALPVTVRYRGDAQTGKIIRSEGLGVRDWGLEIGVRDWG